MLDRLEFILGEAFSALRRNSLMSLAAITTVAVSLFFLGGMTLIYINLSAYLADLPRQLDARVHLKMEVSEMKEISRVADRIRGMEGVQAVQWIPRDLAWERERLKLGYGPNEIPNPLNDALKVTWKDLSVADETTKEIEGLPEVEAVRQHTEAQRTVSEFIAMVRNVGIGMGGILLLTGGILIFNAIKLTVISRRREIRIMQLVGASRATINTPFVIEGTMQGAAGGLLACLILWSAFVAIKQYVNNNLGMFRIVQEYHFPLMLGALLTAGALYGLFCSTFALREPTKLR